MLGGLHESGHSRGARSTYTQQAVRLNGGAMATVVPIRSSHAIAKAVRDSARLAQHGLTLPEATLRALRKRGIYCQSFLTLEFQSQLRRYVLRGTESGGAVADMGRYSAFLNSSGEPLPWLQPI